MPFVADTNISGFKPDTGADGFKPDTATGPGSENTILGKLDQAPAEKKQAIVGAVMDKAKGIFNTFSSFTDKVDSFLKQGTQETAETLGGIGVAGKNIVSGATKAVKGDWKGANKELSAEANLPLLGRTKPFFSGEESFGEGAKKMITGGVELGAVLPAGKLGKAGKTALKTVEAEIPAVASAAKGMAKEGLGAVKEVATEAVERLAVDPVKRATKALTLSSEEMGKTKTIQALKEGLGEAGGVVQKAALKVSPNVQRLATDLAPYIKSKNPIRNLKSMGAEIAREDNLVGRELRKINAVISPNKIKSTLNKALADVTDLTANQTLVKKMKKQIIDNIMEEMKIPKVTKNTSATKKVYHVTPSRNVSSIRKNGIRATENMDGRTGAFVFKNADDAEYFNDIYYDGEGKILDIDIDANTYKKLKKDLSGDMPDSAAYSETDIKPISKEIKEETSQVNKYAGTLEELWKGRKQIDRIAREKKKIFSGSPTLTKEIVTKSRDAIQNLIKTTAEKAGTGFDYHASMKKMAQMYDAIDIFATKAEKKLGTSGVERLIDSIFGTIASPIAKVAKKLIK